MRVLRAAGTATALITASVGLLAGAGVSHASASSKPTFWVETGFDRTVPVRTGGHGEAFRPLSMSIRADGTALQGVKVVVDATGLKGAVELSLGKNCSFTGADHQHELCTLGNLPIGALGGAGAAAEFSVGVRAAVGAVAGQQGNVTFKVTADNAVEAANQHDYLGVTVGDGPDLAINDLGSVIKTPAGKTTALPLRLTNLGSTDAKGIVIGLHDQRGNATVPGNFSNCVYGSYQGGVREVECSFPDAVVKPGQTFQLQTPFSVSVPAGAHGDQIQYYAGLSKDDWIGTPTGTKGTGPVLQLVQVTGAGRAVATPDPSKDIDTYNNLYYTNIDTGIVSDVAAVGGTVNGVVGKVSTVTVGTRNSGNTTFTSLINIGPDLPKGTLGTYVTFPGDVQVTSVPKACVVELSGPDGSGYSGSGTPHAYACATQKTVAPGQAVTFAFGIKPLRTFSGDWGNVVALAAEDTTANFTDDVARLVINSAKSSGGSAPSSTAASSSSSAQPSSAASASPTAGGGSLASTGGGSDSTPLMLAGAAAIALGAGAVLVARRRKAVGSHS
ncbi:LPXTG cell wall anchor domain-containing protein [Streptacidiphilus sp. EB103A]|uniref:LPXTG cell wall anchor domain-containing protein n=1 Tax=Streptacidiphilus sp. EB103A TaxID=3156275 RepID=UPI003512FA2F